MKPKRSCVFRHLHYASPINCRVIGLYITYTLAYIQLLIWLDDTFVYSSQIGFCIQAKLKVVFKLNRKLYSS